MIKITKRFIQEALDKKRERLFEEVFDKKIEEELFVIFNCIADQDRQAIKELKENIKNSFNTKFIEDTIWYDEFTTLLDEQITRINKIFGKLAEDKIKSNIPWETIKEGDEK